MAKPSTPTKSRKKKAKRTIARGVVHIQSSFNNTIISISDEKGAVVSWASAGSAGFKGSRKSTPYAAQVAAEKAISACKDFGISAVHVVINGIGSGRESAVRALQASGISVLSIKDDTGIPHNGCRPRKARRV
jgi:small subunit ribosomal protein S11